MAHTNLGNLLKSVRKDYDGAERSPEGDRARPEARTGALELDIRKAAPSSSWKITSSSAASPAGTTAKQTPDSGPN